MQEVVTSCWSSKPSKRWDYTTIGNELSDLANFCPPVQDGEERNFEDKLQQLGDILAASRKERRNMPQQ